jgi:hypothetical protein
MVKFKLQLTRGKQKWRFLGLYDAFRLVENTRFHLEFPFESATFAYHENVICNAVSRLRWSALSVYFSLFSFKEIRCFSLTNFQEIIRKINSI